MNYHYTATKPDDSGDYRATCVEMPHLTKWGSTEASATDGLLRLVRGYLRLLVEHGTPAPPVATSEQIEAFKTSLK